MYGKWLLLNEPNQMYLMIRVSSKITLIYFTPIMYSTSFYTYNSRRKRLREREREKVCERYSEKRKRRRERRRDREREGGIERER